MFTQTLKLYHKNGLATKDVNFLIFSFEMFSVFYFSRQQCVCQLFNITGAFVKFR